MAERLSAGGGALGISHTRIECFGIAPLAVNVKVNRDRRSIPSTPTR
jgi:hypothetical protein